MTTTVTLLPIGDSPSLITPDLVVGFSASYPTGNFIHDVIGSPNPTVTTNGSRLAKGTLTLLFFTEESAHSATVFLRQAVAFQFSTTDLDHADMNLVVSGDITKTLDSESLAAWTVTFDFQEVTS